MAEDESTIQDMNEEAEAEDTVGQKILREHKDHQDKKRCNSRIDQLATPNRRCILALYQDHAYHFDKERAEAIKVKLQELYAMTPEETEAYFEQLREHTRKMSIRKHMRDKFKKLLAKRKKMLDQRRAYRCFKRLLKQCLHEASKKEPLMFVPARLALLRDAIEHQLYEIRNLGEPPDEPKGKLELFIKAVAEWLAIAVENVYFCTHFKKDEVYIKLEGDATPFKETKKDEVKKENVENIPELLGYSVNETLPYDWKPDFASTAQNIPQDDSLPSLPKEFQPMSNSSMVKDEKKTKPPTPDKNREPYSARDETPITMGPKNRVPFVYNSEETTIIVRNPKSDATYAVTGSKETSTKQRPKNRVPYANNFEDKPRKKRSKRKNRVPYADDFEEKPKKKRGKNRGVPYANKFKESIIKGHLKVHCPKTCQCTSN